MVPAIKPLTFREVPSMQSVRRLWLAQLVSVMGDFLALFAVLSVVSFRLHGTPTQVTLISISYMLPFAFIGPFAGVFVDRWNVKRTMIASDLVRAVLALALVLVTNVYQVYVVLFFLSAVSSFFMPAQSVTVRTIVPKEGLLTANALMQQAFQVTRIISPAVAGALVASLGPEICYYLDSASFVVSALMLSTIAINRVAQQATAPQSAKLQSIFSDLSEGVKFIFTHTALSFVVLSMTAAMFAISCFSPLIAIYVRDFLKAGSLLFGLLSSLIGVGMIACSQLIHRLGKGRSHSHLVVGGLLGIGFSVFLLGAVNSVFLAACGMFGMGMGVMFILIPAQTLMQQETPPAMVGRVSSSFMSVLSVAQLVGLVFSGSMAQAIGIRPLFMASSALLFLIGLAGVRTLRKNVSAAPEVVSNAPQQQQHQ